MALRVAVRASSGGQGGIHRGRRLGPASWARWWKGGSAEAEQIVCRYHGAKGCRRARVGDQGARTIESAARSGYKRFPYSCIAGLLARSDLNGIR